RVADPHCRQILLVPVVQMRLWRRRRTVQAVKKAELPASTAQPVRYAQSERLSFRPISNHSPLQMPELPDFPERIIRYEWTTSNVNRLCNQAISTPIGK